VNACSPDAACLANEAVVDDLENKTRRMVEFLGLPSVEAVLRFHETEQPVSTASVNQVRADLSHVGGPLVQTCSRFSEALGVTSP
jgi:hypothetical protein